MASPRTLTARILLLLALALPAAGAAGCGEDADPASARVGPGSAGAAGDAGAKDAGAGEAAAEDAADAGDLVPGAVDEPDAGAAPQPAGGGVAPGDPPYEGDGDGDSSDDVPPGGATAGDAGDAGDADDPSRSAGGDAGAGGAAAPSGGTGDAAGGAEAAAGDEDPVAVSASFVLEDGSASPMRAEVPAFLGIALEVENAEAHAVQVRLRAPGAETFTVGAGETVSRTVAGVPPGLYPLEVDGGASGAVVIAEG